MRRAGTVAAGVLLLALALGLARMNADMADEVDAAMALARSLAQAQALSDPGDPQALARLQALHAESPLRHLRLQVLDAQGRALLAPVPEAALPWPLAPLLQLHRQVFTDEARVVSWPLPRPGGQHWTVVLQASHDGEREEALLNLLGMMAVLLLCVAGLLLAMRANLRRAFAPLHTLLSAMARIERGDSAAARQLPPMPVAELDAVAQALRHLAQALEAGQAERRALSQRVITLQEDERSHLARELHDEFGQQLTALHVDAAWLARRLHGDDQALEVVQSLTGHCRHIRHELKSVLARLRPLQGLADDAGMPVAALQDLLRSLVQGWQGLPAPAPAVTLQLQQLDAPGAPQHLPEPMALALYRITQEALTNAARHASAQQVTVRLAWQPGPDQGPGPGQLHWQVQDDGVGLADPAAALLRGSGLAGLHERVWALGADLQLGPARPDGVDAAPVPPGTGRPGLRLQAVLPLPVAADGAGAAAAAGLADQVIDQRSPTNTLRGAPGARNNASRDSPV